MDSRRHDDGARPRIHGGSAHVPPHRVVGDTVREMREIGREVSRAFGPDGDEMQKSGARQQAKDPRETRARKRANQLRELYTHLGVYAIVIGFLFILDLITGSGLWFYWPALGWGVGVAIHAFTVLGPEVAFGQHWEDRKVSEWLGEEPPRERPSQTAGSSPTDGGDMTGLVGRGIAEVADLRRTALDVGNTSARAQSLRICATADNILAALSEEGRETRMAREFLDRYLAPTRTILSQYVRLSSRGVASAEPALERVESHDLPLIERRMNELYDRIHRGDVIDLEVASEMLDMGLIDRGTGATLDERRGS